MKKNLFLTILSLFPVISFAGPFGFDIGKNLDHYPRATFTKMENSNVKYRVENPPTPNKSMELYVVYETEESGICFIKGMSVNITTSAYGTSLITKYNSVADAVDSKYGATYKKEVTDFLSYGSIWDEPNDYMMSLLKGERYAYISWKAKDKANPIESIYLAQAALDTETGYFSIEYYGNNKEICDAEENKSDSEGF